MPKAVLSQGPTHQTTYVRDDHDESGVVHAKTVIHDDRQLERNKRERLDGAVKAGSRFGLRDGGEIIYHYRIDPVAWKIFKRKHPEIVTALRSRDQVAREKAAASMRAMHPEWVVTAPGTHHF